MKLTRRESFFIIWLFTTLFAGVLVDSQTFGVATVFALISISIGVPLMKAVLEKVR